MQLLCSLPPSSNVGEEGAMRVQLAQQAKAILGQSDLVIITERVDDVALLIGQMVKMACQTSWTGTSRAIGRNGGSVGGGQP